jgi:hypothetical protein
MTAADELRTLVCTADICAHDYEHGLIVTPATAAGLWRAIAQLAGAIASDAETSARRVERLDEVNKRVRRATARKGSR